MKRHRKSDIRGDEAMTVLRGASGSNVGRRRKAARPKPTIDHPLSHVSAPIVDGVVRYDLAEPWAEVT